MTATIANVAMLEKPDPTEAKQTDHLWKPGQSGNPAGRKEGSKNRLGEAFVLALAKDFDLYGEQAIEEVRTKSPKDYLKVIASVMPRDIFAKLEVSGQLDLKAQVTSFSQA